MRGRAGRRRDRRGGQHRPRARRGGQVTMAFTEDVRARLEVDAKEIIARYPKARSALLPLLHLVQAEQGYVTQDGIGFCADMLNITAAEVTAVVTFYTMYKQEPAGEYHVGVCTNTLCAVMGGDQIFAELSEHLGIGNHETTEDGRVSIERVECNAACDFAPVVMVNWEFFDNQSPETVKRLVDDLRVGNDVKPTRGADRVCTWREASRVLAGFPDGRAGEGVQAAGPTLEGLNLARARGWTAPAAGESNEENDQ
ncbi:MAG: NADH-quinone oxidoreductase subunit NuoE [Streptosporangiales bacterium]|nr:NADH-quinone oxidoreductase subunit NuoE [Streptosporangiales bacterium]